MWWLLFLACEPPAPDVVIDARPRVAVEAALPAPAALHRALPGLLEPTRDATLSPRVPGTVARRLAEPGRAVRSGQGLLRLDDADARAQLAAAEAAVDDASAVLAQADAAVARLERLGDAVRAADGQDAALARDRALAGLAAARARRELAASQLAHHTVRAPFDGVVAALEPEVGESVGPGLPVARVTTTDRLVVRVGLLADEARAAADGLATFEVEVAGERREAALRSVPLVADPRTLDWTATLEVAGGGWLAGSPATVHIGLAVAGGGALVVSDAVAEGRVWVVEGGRASARAVEVRGEEAGRLLVGGVGPGEAVVVGGAGLLHGRGEAVEVVVVGSP